MCGRFDNHLAEMHGWAGMLSEWPDVPLSYNVAPSAQIAVFANLQGETRQDEQLKGISMRWGMVPSWAKEFSSKYATFNARVETVADKPTFRNAWKHQQTCLLPMQGYYEWAAVEEGKQPFFITDRNVGGLVAAGLYEIWRDEHNTAQLSCTMLTRPADPGLDRIHQRMPILLTPDTAHHWMSEAQSNQQLSLLEMETPELVYWPVAKAVGNVRNNHAQLSAPVDLANENS